MPGLASSSLPPKEVCGVPVYFRMDTKHPIADARGYGKKAHIVVGPGWYRLDPATQRSILYHEARHILGHHREIRVFMLALLAVPALMLLPWPVLLCITLTTIMYFCVQRIAQDQELEADRFAAEQGSGAELLAFLRACGPPGVPPFFYPDFERRIGSLKRFMEEANALRH